MGNAALIERYGSYSIIFGYGSKLWMTGVGGLGGIYYVSLILGGEGGGWLDAF